MTRDAFVSLSQANQLAFALDQGREVMGRIYLYYVIKLFLVEDFYVELWYRLQQNTVDKILVVELDDVIHLYEKEIDISDLFRNPEEGGK